MTLTRWDSSQKIRDAAAQRINLAMGSCERRGIILPGVITAIYFFPEGDSNRKLTYVEIHYCGESHVGEGGLRFVQDLTKVLNRLFEIKAGTFEWKREGGSRIYVIGDKKMLEGGPVYYVAKSGGGDNICVERPERARRKEIVRPEISDGTLLAWAYNLGDFRRSLMY